MRNVELFLRIVCIPLILFDLRSILPLTIIYPMSLNLHLALFLWVGEHTRAHRIAFASSNVLFVLIKVSLGCDDFKTAGLGHSVCGVMTTLGKYNLRWIANLRVSHDIRAIQILKLDARNLYVSWLKLGSVVDFVLG